MWVESFKPHVEGVLLLRYARTFLAVIITALLATTVFSSVAFAADAKWENAKLVYDERSYASAGAANKAVATQMGIPEGSEYYETIDEEVTPNVSRILYFPPDTNKENAANATYKEFTLEGGGTAGTKYDQVRGPTQVAVDQASYETGGTAEETSCAVDGIGFIICPIMNLLAEAMDKMFNVLKSFLHVAPLTNNSHSGLYKAWSFMLALANVCFVIGFIVIIYSYITDQGVKQYDVRKVIPRIIIAAILINASYYICALAVDVSNIFGANLQDVFNGMRNELTSDSETVTDTNAWNMAAITTLVLSAGTIGGGLYVGLGTFAGAALHLLTPVLVASVIAVLVALVVLAARQALITVLIIISPIAFAAFILPSTQKYFDKWKDVFMTMLLVYPMFSILFGGSQLAAHLIAQNATGILTIIFAMFIQVAPLVVTPFLIKFSGSLLGKIAGIVNNPAKGLGDKAKNFSQRKRELAMNKRVADGARGTGLARRLMDGKAFDEAELKKTQTRRKRNRDATQRGRDLAVGGMYEEMMSKTVDNDNKALFDAQKLGKGNPEQLDAARHARSELQSKVNASKVSALMHELETHAGGEERAVDNPALAGVAHEMHDLGVAEKVTSQREAMAKALHDREFTNMLSDDGKTGTELQQALRLQQEAGGVHPEGAHKVKAAVGAQLVRDSLEDVKAIKDASPIAAGDVEAMRIEFTKAAQGGDLASMRAHADMLADAKNYGITALRELIELNEPSMRSNPGQFEVFKHHINSSAAINSGAEDIASWSRDKRKRSLGEVGADYEIWKDMAPGAFGGNKKSTQLLGLKAKNADGVYAITAAKANAILKNDNIMTGIKPEVEKELRKRAENRLDVR